MASRLAEIYRSEKKTGGGLGSSIGKSLKEKIDPRQMLDQSGLLVSMFPSLKSFNATRGKGVAEKVSSNVGGGIDNSMLNTLAATSSLSAKNSMVLPMMARDMNLTKLNIMKLVKATGQKSTMNHDAFWNNAKTRESAYENTIGKIAGKGMIGKMAKSAFVGKQNRDGQSPESALFVQTGGAGLNTEGMLSGLLNSNTLKSILTATVGFLTSPVALTVMGGAALFGIMKTLMDKNSDKEGVDLATKALGGGLDESQFGSEIMNAAEEGQRQREAEDLKRRTVSGPLERLPEKLPDTGAGGGRGFVNPELVSPSPSPVPSNVIMSGSGVPLTSGSGEYITSGTSPVSTTGTAQGTMGSYVSRGASPSPVSSGGQSAGLNMPDKTIGDYIKDASKRVGVDEGIMLAMANQESSFNPSAKPVDKKTGKLLSSAKGLYQFLNSTWDSMVSKYSKNFPELLKGPLDPLASAVAGALYIKENGQYLASKGVPVTGTSIYAAHFLGPGGAKSLFTADPSADASKVLPAAASSNKHIFYNKDGTPKSVEGVIQTLYGKVGQKAEQYAAVVNPSNIKQSSSSTVVASPSKPSSGSVVASASTSVSDGKMAAMAPSSGNTVINNKPTTVASNKPSSGGKTASTYDNEIFQSLVGYQSGTA